MPKVQTAEPCLESVPKGLRATPMAFPSTLILLGGALRADSLANASRRHCLEWPIADGVCLGDLWKEAVSRLRDLAGIGALPVRVLLGGGAHESCGFPLAPAGFSLEYDPVEFRGTGGVLRDLAAGYPDEEYALVANAAQLFIEPLPSLVAEMAGLDADVILVSHDDGTPSGLTLVRWGALRCVPSLGYIDLKEQALPIISKHARVRVLTRAGATALPIRTVSNYVTAALHYSKSRTDPKWHHQEFAELCHPSFSVVEPGAVVHPTARVHDSIVFAGAKVGAGAHIIRSVVCGGAVVAKGKLIVETLVRS